MRVVPSIVMLVLLCWSAALADDPAPAADFVRDVQPIFAKHCLDCHGADSREAGLRLDRRVAALAGGDTGPVIVPGQPDESLLVKYVSGDGETIMPPDVLNKLLPEFVSPLVAYLASEGLEETAQVYAVGGGYFSRVAVMEGEGTYLDPSKGVTPEQLAERWKQINDLSKARAFNNAMEAAGQAMKAVMGG